MNEHSSINYMTVFREPGRDAFLTSARDGAPFFDTVTDAWIVTNPELCKTLLSSAALAPAPAVEGYRGMPANLADDFQSMAFAFDHNPLCLHGAPHAVARRATSEFIATRRGELNSWLTGDLPRLLAPLGRPGSVDVLGEVLLPVMRGMISTMIGVELPAHLHLDDISAVFDKSISMRRRRIADSDIRAIHQHLQSVLPELSEAEIGARLSLVILGKDSIIGSLGESLHFLLQDAGEKRLDELAWPGLMPQTGVPFVERIAVAPASFDGLEIKQGERLRLFLQTYAHGAPELHHRFFGGGAHACLGRPASTDLWEGVTAFLGKVPLRARIVSYELTSDAYVFAIPKKFELELRP